MMLALRDFQFVDEMYTREPNITLMLFVFFVIAVIYFLADIFISLVILVFNEVIKQQKKKAKHTNEDALRETHFTLRARDFCIALSKRCNCGSKRAKQENEADENTKELQSKLEPYGKDDKELD